MSGRYTLNFLGQGTRRDPDPSHYRPYFVDYDPAKWDADPAGGSFLYIDEDGNRYGCVIAHSAAHGICVMVNARQGGSRRTHVTVGDPSRMDEIVDVGVDEFYPAGAFVAPEAAWEVVEAFLRDPTAVPDSPVLVDIEKADWPDLYG